MDWKKSDLAFEDVVVFNLGPDQVGIFFFVSLFEPESFSHERADEVGVVAFPYVELEREEVAVEVKRPVESVGVV